MRERQHLNFKLRYEPALDGLRGVAVLAVLAFHGQFLGRGGFLGVDIFFVLSGFLITALLAQEHTLTGTINFRGFYLRRALRLFPALFSVIIVLIAAAMIEHPGGSLWPVLRSVLPALYLSDFLPVHHLLVHTWSLSIEEQFYVAWPFLFWLLLLLRLRRRWSLLLLLLLILGVAVNRAMLWHQLYSGSETFPGRTYATFDTRTDALLIGCVAGILLSYNLIPVAGWTRAVVKFSALVAVVVFGVLIFIARLTSPSLYNGGFTVLAVLAGMFIVSLFVAPIKPLVMVLESRALVWVGRISYGLYLWHVPVFSVVKSAMPALSTNSYTLRTATPVAVGVAASIAVAALSFYVIEQPCLQLKKRFKVARVSRKTPAESTLLDGSVKL